LEKLEKREETFFFFELNYTKPKKINNNLQPLKKRMDSIIKKI